MILGPVFSFLLMIGLMLSIILIN